MSVQAKENSELQYRCENESRIPKVTRVVFSYHYISKGGVKNCSIQAKDRDDLWRILEEIKVYVGLYH